MSLATDLQEECPPTFFNKGTYKDARGSGTSRIDSHIANWPASLMINACMLRYTDAIGLDHVATQDIRHP